MLSVTGIVLPILMLFASSRIANLPFTISLKHCFRTTKKYLSFSTFFTRPSKFDKYWFTFRSINAIKRDCLTSNLHETQKPIALLENLIKTFSNEGDIVLDSCMGSGSTCVACINTNRKFIGIELNDEYFNIANKRVEESL